MKNRTYRIIILGFAILLFTSGQVAAGDLVIKIGQKYPLTGQWAYYGVDSKKGLDLAADYINARGGIKSMGGAKIENIYSDSQSRPEIAVSENERLITQEGVHLLTGEIFSFLTIPATVVSERLKTPYYVPVSAANAITERGFKYLFRQSQKGKEWGEGIVPFLLDLKKMGVPIKKVAMMNNDTEWGVSGAAGATEEMKKQGFDVVSHIPYPSKATDFSSYITKAHMKNPDVVVRISFLRDTVALSKLQKMMRMKAPHIGISSGDTMNPMIEKLGADAEGRLALNSWNWDLLATQWANDMYKKKYGQDMYNEVAAAFQAMMVIWEALELAGSKVDFSKIDLAAQREAIRDALAAVKVKPGQKIIFPWDEISFDESGHNTKGGSGGFVVHQVVDGKFVTVWPEKDARRKIDLKAAGLIK